jgi:DNA-binding LacI/PurR family transcriptional regulator
VPVPDALALTGWDDADAAAAAGLTTVAQSLHDQGAQCARLALGGAATGVHEASWRVVRRASTRG